MFSGKTVLMVGVFFFLKGLVLPYANKRFGEFTVIILFVRSTALDLHLG